jgi:hypothetical protein
MPVWSKPSWSVNRVLATVREHDPPLELEYASQARALSVHHTAERAAIGNDPPSPGCLELLLGSLWMLRSKAYPRFSTHYQLLLSRWMTFITVP